MYICWLSTLAHIRKWSCKRVPSPVLNSKNAFSMVWSINITYMKGTYQHAHEIMQCFIRQRSHNHQLITVVRPSSQHHTLEDNESTRQPPLPTLNRCAHVPLHFWCNLSLTSWVQEQRRRAWLHQCPVIHNQHNGTTLRLSTNRYPL